MAINGPRIMFTYVMDATNAIVTSEQVSQAEAVAAAQMGKVTAKLTEQTWAFDRNGNLMQRSVYLGQGYSEMAESMARGMQQVANIGKNMISVYTSWNVWQIREQQYAQQLLVTDYRVQKLKRELLQVYKELGDEQLTVTNISLQEASAKQTLYDVNLKVMGSMNDLRVQTGETITAIGRFGADSIEAENATLAWLDSMKEWGTTAVQAGVPMSEVQKVMDTLKNNILTGQIPAWDQLAEQVGWNTEKYGPLGTAGLTAAQVLAAGSDSVTGAFNNQVTAQQELNNAQANYADTVDAANSALEESKAKLAAARQELALMTVNIGLTAMGTTAQIMNAYKTFKEFNWGSYLSNAKELLGSLKSSVVSMFGGMAKSAATFATSTASSIASSMPVAAASIGSVGVASSTAAVQNTAFTVSVQGQTVAAAQGTVAMGGLATSEIAVGPASTVAAGGISMVSAALTTLLMNPLTWIVVAIGAVILILYELYQNFAPFRDGVNGVASALMDGLGAAVKFIGDGLKWLWDNILAPIANFVTNVLLVAWNIFAAGVKQYYLLFIKPVVDALAWAYEHVFKPVADFLAPIGKALGAVGDALGNWFGQASDAVGNANKQLEEYNRNLDKTIANSGKVSSPTTEGESGSSVKGSRATGGTIPVTGMYELHAGEEVQPAAIAQSQSSRNQETREIHNHYHFSGLTVQVKEIADAGNIKKTMNALRLGYEFESARS